jgi:hypothetical protein
MASEETMIYLTADHLEQRAASRVREAQLLPPGEARQHALRTAGQLRSYAAMKRYFTAPPAKL